jgi:3-hydroxyisobutyrate dehydrogenase
VNQVLVSVTNMAVSEALVFARRSGLDLERTLAAVGGGAAGSWQLANLGPKMIAGDFRPGFMIDLQQKDLRLVLEAAGEVGLSAEATKLVHERFKIAQAKGRGRDGTQGLFRVIEEGG